MLLPVQLNDPCRGDSVILKGGVTWPTASLGWNWIWSGNATASSPGCTGTGCIYIGVDQTWYAGNSWTRPILNGGGAIVNTPSNGVANVLLRLYANYVIVDNIEFTGVYWTGVPSYGSGTNIQIAAGTPGIGTNIEIKNIYVHGWSHGTRAAGTSENPCGVVGDTGIPNNNVNTILHDSVIDGGDTDKASCSALFGSPPYVERNIIQYVTSAMILNGTVLIDSNTIQNVVPSFDSSAHENGIEINASYNVTISNNNIGHLGAGVLGIWCAPDQTYSCTIFNNVLYDTDTGNVLDLAAPVANNGCANSGTYCSKGGSAALYNNTVQCGPNSNPNAVCVAGINAAISGVALENNYFITNQASPNNGVWATNGVTPTETTDLKQLPATATSQGYAVTETYPFSPVSGGSTVGAGTNLTSLCSGNQTTLCNDTTLGVIYNTTTHTVITPNRTPKARSNGPWDIGAYSYASGSTGVLPPTNLTALPK